MIHRYVLSEMNRRDLLANIPENKALENLAKAMIEAWRVYAQPKSVILFIIEDQTFNICDQVTQLIFFLCMPCQSPKKNP